MFCNFTLVYIHLCDLLTKYSIHNINESIINKIDIWSCLYKYYKNNLNINES